MDIAYVEHYEHIPFQASSNPVITPLPGYFPVMKINMFQSCSNPVPKPSHFHSHHLSQVYAESQ